jgi:hypothetical protein
MVFGIPVLVIMPAIELKLALQDSITDREVYSTWIVARNWRNMAGDRSCQALYSSFTGKLIPGTASAAAMPLRPRAG